jgi:hypothetical protein
MTELYKASLWTLKALIFFFSWLWFGLMGVWDWAKGFGVVKDASGFLFPKIIIFLVGKHITPFPTWALLFIAFLPPPFVGLLYFLTIIIVLKQ